MKTRILCAGVASAFAFSNVSTPAHAVEYSGVSVQQLAALTSSLNISFTYLDSGVVTGDGLKILLSRCNQTACGEISFSRDFGDVKPTIEAVNRWNYERKVPEASRSGNGNLHLEMWLSATGMTDTIFRDTYYWFEGAWRDQEFWSPYVVYSGS